MNRMIIAIGKGISSLLLTIVAVLAVFSVSPIYDFSAPDRFTGENIFNPYAGCDSAVVWKRANFHTHTRVDGLMNECEYWPDHVDSCYRSFGYDIVTFSNHNRLTAHPYDSSLQVNVYEHGYNLFKYHKLVFGSDAVWRFDHLLPILASQRQWQLDMLGRGSDIIQLNHPFRTNCTSRSVMEKLSGYDIIELDSGVTTDQEYWDWALSAGHYSFALASDDLHYPDRSDRFAVRCSWLDCPSARYEDIRETLLSGRYYCMRIPDYGNGDWQVKRESDRLSSEGGKLPCIKRIGLTGDSLYVELSDTARIIRINGQEGAVLASAAGCDSFGYRMKADDSYARITAFFDDGCVIYTNPFARYDGARYDGARYDGARPGTNAGHSVNIFLTILFNLALALIVAVCVWLMTRMYRNKTNPE